MGGHRKGARNNPPCRGPGPRGPGKVWMIDPGSGPWVARVFSEEIPAPASPASQSSSQTSVPDSNLAPPEEAGGAGAGPTGPWEYRLQDPLDDLQTRAPEMNRQMQAGDSQVIGNGHGPTTMEELEAAGEWVEDRGPAVQKVPGGSETVYLPAVIKVWYQWCLDNGWKVGDGSLGAWVTDVLLTHMNVCMGKGIYVMDRTEVQNATGGT